MNTYELFISKLKAMQVQGHTRTKILEKYRIWKPTVILYLEKELMVAVIASDFNKEKILRQNIKYVGDLNEIIEVGLLE